MPLEYSFPFPLPNGLHARPASHFAELVGTFRSRVILTNERTGAIADAASVLDLVGAAIGMGDPCRILISGVDEESAHASITSFVQSTLPACDQPLPEPVAQGEARLPRALAHEEATCLSGIPVSRGIGWGRVVAVASHSLTEELRSETSCDVAIELDKLTKALDAVRTRLEAQAGGASNATEAGILRAHISIVTDPALCREASELITRHHRTVGQAVVEAMEGFVAKLSACDSDYLRERISDLRDVGAQILENVYGRPIERINLALREASVVVAKNLSPSQLLSLDRRFFRSLILEEAGTTSHAVILARSFGIPTIVGVHGASVQASGQEVVVDANRGIVVIPVSAGVRRFYDREIERERRRRSHLARSVVSPVMTRDGYRLEVAANIATGTEAEEALAGGAEGIGLFRTEMMFFEREVPPSEEEQFDVYKNVLQAMNGKPVTIRTFDIGGDKPLPYLDMPCESNPFLGYRGIRLYKDHEEMFACQVRAIVRASAFGPIRVMAPMVSVVEEAAWFREKIIEIQADLTARRIGFDRGMRIGIMIEVPSSALIVDQLSEFVDFFSIGTNDLCQYFLAIDRGNERVSRTYSERHPSFLRLLKSVVDQAHRHGKRVGLCGEMAACIENMPLLIGLGLDEISLSSPGIPEVSATITRLSRDECRHVFESSMASNSRAEVDDMLMNSACRSDSDVLITPEMVALSSDSRTKEEAIKELTDLLYVVGRTDSPEQVEEAVWAREATFSTGLGCGFAIPHCKSGAVNVNSIAILKLNSPIEWGSPDDKPVEVVILLAIRESDTDNTHLRILSRLARKLMSEEFRNSIVEAKDPHLLILNLTRMLELE